MLIAFWFLENKESPKTFFDFFVERYKDKPPGMIVYDHACGLAAYALNRLPIFFRETRFRIDVFHWPNHVACSEAFNFSAFVPADPDQYKWNTNEARYFVTAHCNRPACGCFFILLIASLLVHLSSQAEHFNRRMKKFRHQASFMDSRHAIPFTEAVHREFMRERLSKLVAAED